MTAPLPPTYNVQTEFNAPATMRDGTILRANIYRPIGDGPFPVLLTRLPYGKDFPIGSAILDPVQTARQGYIVVVQDTRGRFASDGEPVLFTAERADGYDSVQWAAGLPGSNGLVGMYGASYFGFTQWAAAREHPSALRALFPFITWADPMEGTFMRGGAVELGIGRHWGVQNALDTHLKRAAASGDPRQIGATLLQTAAELDALPIDGYADLPLKGYSERRHDDATASFDLAIDRRQDADYLDLVNVANGYDQLDLPAFHAGGWYDIFLGGTLRNFTALTQRGKAPQKLLVGPWTHTGQSEVVGDVAFGFGSAAALINMQTDLQSLQRRWFDHFLKEQPNGIDKEPPIQLFVMGINQWRYETAWPLARAVQTPYYLHSQGHAHGLAGDGGLSAIPPESEPADHYQYDPLNPVPTVGGATLMHPLFRPGPRDQRPVERRDDVLSFTSEPMAQPLEVTGPITVTLYAATDGPDTDFVARLVDVHPDGFARNLTDGIIRGRMRDGVAKESLLTPGQTYAFTIDLWATSNVFLPGHRIRLDVTSSNFPRWDRNLNTGAPFGEGKVPRTATQTILHDREHPSHILLPVVPAT